MNPKKGRTHREGEEDIKKKRLGENVKGLRIGNREWRFHTKACFWHFWNENMLLSLLLLNLLISQTQRTVDVYRRSLDLDAWTLSTSYACPHWSRPDRSQTAPWWRGCALSPRGLTSSRPPHSCLSTSAASPWPPPVTDPSCCSRFTITTSTVLGKYSACFWAWNATCHSLLSLTQCILVGFHLI